MRKKMLAICWALGFIAGILVLFNSDTGWFGQYLSGTIGGIIISLVCAAGLLLELYCKK